MKPLESIRHQLTLKKITLDIFEQREDPKMLENPAYNYNLGIYFGLKCAEKAISDYLTVVTAPEIRVPSDFEFKPVEFKPSEAVYPPGPYECLIKELEAKFDKFKWRPISELSADHHDGRNVLFFIKNKPFVQSLRFRFFSEISKSFWTDVNDDIFCVNYYSHFFELPPLPKMENEE